MARRTYTDDQKSEALELYVEHGACETARRTGIPQKTISSWAARSNVQSTVVEKMHAAHVANQAKNSERRDQVIARLWEIADRASRRELELLEASGLRDVVGARTRAIHDAQLLSGDATSRTEELAPAERKDRMVELRDELAERRAKKAS